MSGALAERVFVHKVHKAGFTGVRIVDRRPFGIDDCEGPLFTPDLIELMRRLIPSDQHREVATALTMTAHRPSEETRP